MDAQVDDDDEKKDMPHSNDVKGLNYLSHLHRTHQTDLMGSKQQESVLKKKKETNHHDRVPNNQQEQETQISNAAELRPKRKEVVDSGPPTKRLKSNSNGESNDDCDDPPNRSNDTDSSEDGSCTSSSTGSRNDGEFIVPKNDFVVAIDNADSFEFGSFGFGQQHAGPLIMPNYQGMTSPKIHGPQIVPNYQGTTSANAYTANGMTHEVRNRS